MYATRIIVSGRLPRADEPTRIGRFPIIRRISEENRIATVAEKDAGEARIMTANEIDYNERSARESKTDSS